MTRIPATFLLNLSPKEMLTFFAILLQEICIAKQCLHSVKNISFPILFIVDEVLLFFFIIIIFSVFRVTLIAINYDKFAK